MGNLGFAELAVIFVVALLLVGPKRLPGIARAMGEAFQAFQDTLRGTSSKSDAPDKADDD